MIGNKKTAADTRSKGNENERKNNLTADEMEEPS
jgi:hypothetical protein